MKPLGSKSQIPLPLMRIGTSLECSVCVTENVQDELNTICCMFPLSQRKHSGVMKAYTHIQQSSLPYESTDQVRSLHRPDIYLEHS